MMDIYGFEYDLKNELTDCQQGTKDAIHKFLLYRLSAKAKNFDCDRCAYIKNVYAQLWGFDNSLSGSYQNIAVGDKQILMGMETMNSFFTTFAWALNKWCLKDIKKEIGIEVVESDSVEKLYENYDVLKAIMEKHFSKQIMDSFLLFAQLTHTIGNMILVPKDVAPYTGSGSFNMARSSRWNDYFDLSLLWLYNNDEENWTKETFLAYAKKFYLMDYITPNGKVIPLVRTHKKILKGDFDEESRPESKRELLELLNNINNRISHRGKLMHAKLLGDEATCNAILQRPVANSKAAVKVSISPKNKRKRKKLNNFRKYRVTTEIDNHARTIFWSSLAVNMILAILLLPYTMFACITIFSLTLFGLIGILVAPILNVYGAYYLSKRRKRKYIEAKTVPTIETLEAISRVDFSLKSILSMIILEAVFVAIVYFIVRAEGITSWFQAFMAFLFGGMVVLLPLLCYYIRYGMRTRCKNCKCFFTLKMVRRIHSKPKEVLKKGVEEVITDAYDINTGEYREVVTYRDTLVKGSETEYEETYKCRWCNCRFVSFYTIKR